VISTEAGDPGPRCARLSDYGPKSVMRCSDVLSRGVSKRSAAPRFIEAALRRRDIV
jgi:hypothetical protein